MEKIKFGIIGCGRIAARFAEALRRSDCAELYAVAARDPARAESFAREHSAAAFYGSYADLVADSAVQAVYIATVHTAHAAAARLCLEAGRAVLCEKPFFTSSAEAREVVALARQRGVLAMEGFWTRTQPAYQKAREWIADGRIGELKLIRAAACFAMPYIEQTRSHRLWDPALGGGALLDMGVYPYEYVTGLMGGPPAELKTTVSRGESGVDATVAMTMLYPNGVVADCLTSIAGYMDGDAVISGSAGYIKQYYFLGCRKTELYGPRGELVEVYDDPEEEGFVHEIAHFVSLLRGGAVESPLVPLDDTLDFAALVDRTLRPDAPKAPSRFSLSDLCRQEETLRFDSFTAAEACALADTLLALQRQDGTSAAVQIELGGFEVYRYMPQGTGRYNDLWLSKKRATVRMMSKSTLRLWSEMAAMGFKRAPELAPSGELVLCGGGFPLLLRDGSLAGVVAVSSPSGDEYEHDLVTRALAALLTSR